jgi:hypothetical protein
VVVEVVDGRQGRGGQLRQGRRGRVRHDLGDVAGTGNDRRDPRLLDDPAQRGLGRGRRRRGEGGELLRGLYAGVVVDAGEGLAGVERLAVPVVGAVSCRYLPDSRPEASGTRAMIATSAAFAAGSTSARGLRRKALRMICTLVTPGRAIAVRASAEVSTLTPYAAMRCSSTRVSSASNTASVEYTAVGGQCSCTRSSTSTSRLRRDRSVQARKFSSV